MEVKVEIPESLWKKACENMARASDETVEVFGAMINNTPKIPFDWATVKRILEYVASNAFLKEEREQA